MFAWFVMQPEYQHHHPQFAQTGSIARVSYPRGHLYPFINMVPQSTMYPYCEVLLGHITSAILADNVVD